MPQTLDQSTYPQLIALINGSYGDRVDRIAAARLEDNDDIICEAIDGRKRLAVRIGADEIAIKLMGGDKAAEALKFAAASKKKICKTGISCGFTCITATKVCRKSLTPRQKQIVNSLRQLAKGNSMVAEEQLAAIRAGQINKTRLANEKAKKAIMSEAEKAAYESEKAREEFEQHLNNILYENNEGARMNAAQKSLSKLSAKIKSEESRARDAINRAFENLDKDLDTTLEEMTKEDAAMRAGLVNLERITGGSANSADERLAEATKKSDSDISDISLDELDSENADLQVRLGQRQRLKRLISGEETSKTPLSAAERVKANNPDRSSFDNDLMASIIEKIEAKGDKQSEGDRFYVEAMEAKASQTNDSNLDRNDELRRLRDKQAKRALNSDDLSTFANAYHQGLRSGSNTSSAKANLAYSQEIWSRLNADQKSAVGKEYASTGKVPSELLKKNADWLAHGATNPGHKKMLKELDLATRKHLDGGGK